MANYRISNTAKQDLIGIHQYGVEKFGLEQADKYFESFFKYFEIISQRSYSFEAVDFFRTGYKRCVCDSDSIYYRINNNVVEIMAIIGKQEIESLVKQFPDD